MAEVSVAILGAGPAGLAAAHELTRKGVRTLLVERNRQEGGIARTEVYRDFCFDLGGHRFFTKIDRIQRLWEELLGGDLISVARLSRIYFRGRFFNYPLSPLNTVLNLGPIESARILLSYLRVKLRPSREEKTFEQWVSNRFGRRLYEVFFKTYTEKVWGIPCSEIQADWAAQRIQGLSLVAAVANAVFGRRGAKSLIDRFDYPVRGPGMMCRRLREAIEAGGGEFRFATEVAGLEHRGGRVRSVFLKRGPEREAVAVDHLISTIPLHRLVELLVPPAPPDVLQAARRLTYRAFMMVGLIVHRRHLFDDQWIYIHSPEVQVGRIQNFKNWSAAMVPDPERTGIGMEYFCSEGDALWSLPDPEIRALAIRELAQLGLADPDAVEDGFVIRQPSAYPIYDEGYRERVERLRKFLGGLANVEPAGRAGLHRYNNMDHSMYTGILAAENVLGARHNVWRVNEEKAFLEEIKKSELTPDLAQTVLVRSIARMDKLALAVAVGIVAGLAAFGATLALVLKGGDVIGPNLELLSQYFWGYTVTVEGAFLALGYGLAAGAVSGWLLAYLRNLILGFYVWRGRKRAGALTIMDFLDQL
ncbi:MAG: NAD(P)/FAD-dependent oxidoreductase [Planctomycetes bacterium]|nr:NAD(P)/FAD-dependent oxidoreductase [Planctomycetota bacterium]